MPAPLVALAGAGKAFAAGTKVVVSNIAKATATATKQGVKKGAQVAANTTKAASKKSVKAATTSAKKASPFAMGNNGQAKKPGVLRALGDLADNASDGNLEGKEAQQVTAVLFAVSGAATMGATKGASAVQTGMGMLSSK